jgi:predicted amidohydrolase
MRCSPRDDAGQHVTTQTTSDAGHGATTLTIGLLQTTTGIDVAGSANALAAGIAGLAAQGAQLIFTPEMSGMLDRDRARAAGSVTTEASDVVLAAVRAAAAAHRVWVQLGSLALRAADGEQEAGQGSPAKLVNRAFLIDDHGAISARYDKLHLFDVDLVGGERYRESATYAAGKHAVIAATPWGGLGLTICYDLRFPALYAELAHAGAALIAVPAAFTQPTGAAHWHVLLRARAIETGCFVVTAAQTGVHADGRRTYGHSLVVDPWGRVLLDMGEAPGAAVCTIDLAEVAATRARIPSLAHARPIVMAQT